MRARSTILCLLTLAAWLPWSQAHAQTQPQVYRCTGAHGEPAFSGSPCDTAAATRADDADTAEGSFGGVCPASPEILRQAIGEAFQDRDVNLLAGLILWQGSGVAASRVELRSLTHWLTQPLVRIDAVPSTGPPLPEYATTSAGAGTRSVVATPPVRYLQPRVLRISTGGGAGSTREFGVTRASGCWWLTW